MSSSHLSQLFNRQSTKSSNNESSSNNEFSIFRNTLRINQNCLLMKSSPWNRYKAHKISNKTFWTAKIWETFREESSVFRRNHFRRWLYLWFKL